MDRDDIISVESAPVCWQGESKSKPAFLDEEMLLGTYVFHGTTRPRLVVAIGKVGAFFHRQVAITHQFVLAIVEWFAQNDSSESKRAAFAQCAEILRDADCERRRKAA